MAVSIREPSASELDQLSRVPSAAQFLNHRVLVLLSSNQLASFLIFRSVASDESEILQLETIASFRGRGFARQLLNAFLARTQGSVFLEVRESNTAARHLYTTARFTEIARRVEYYTAPPEDAIVLKFCSC